MSSILASVPQALATHTKIELIMCFFGGDQYGKEIDGNKYTLCKVKPFDPEPWVS